MGQTPPRIVTEPAGLSVPVGGAFSLTIVATGNPPLSYQWHFGGKPIVGATRLAYEVSQAQTTDGGDYQVVVSNPVGSVTSVVARVVVGYQLQVEVRPSGTVQLQPSRSVYEPGEVVQLTALAQADRAFLRWEGDGQGAANP
ncbi:MAG: immunoglobulin domain-containing protein [Verrucomicrobia bacterium]|nr:immunoglobulin domain-containing protein [Verrucomicrobiota bacterium]